MEDKPFDELRISVNAIKSKDNLVKFECVTLAKFECVGGVAIDLSKALSWTGFYIQMPSLSRKTIPKKRAGLLMPVITFAVDSETLRQRSEEAFVFTASTLSPLTDAIFNYELTRAEFEKLRVLSTPDIQPAINQYFGNILKKILEGAGYTITIETPDYYFPSPTGTALVVPAFGYGLLRKAIPFDVENGYESIVTYLSIEKPQSQVQVQLKLVDRLEDRIYEYQKLLKDALTPYGLKCLYLAIAECARNNRRNWFILDTNYCLDRLGYKRNKKGVHQTRSKDRLLREFEALTKIKFNVERRQPKRGDKGKQRAFRITGPVLSISDYTLEEWDVGTNKPIEEGTHITDKVPIFIHPDIYADIEGWYTLIPDDYLTIDTGRRPHAIQLYPHIANQWRIGWNDYKGVITQTLKRILEDTGLIHSYHAKRANKKPGFLESVKESLVWLKNQNQYWIESIEFKEAKNRDPLEQKIIIKMSKGHPLMIGMDKQGKTTG